MQFITLEPAADAPGLCVEVSHCLRDLGVQGSVVLGLFAAFASDLHAWLS